MMQTLKPSPEEQKPEKQKPEEKKPEEKKSPITVTLDVNADDVEEGDDPLWMLTFRIEFAFGCTTEYVVHYPNYTPLAAWRELAQGDASARVCDLNDDNGTITIEEGLCSFSTGTNCRETTNTSATTTVPHAWVAASLSRALDEAVRRQLPFAINR